MKEQRAFTQADSQDKLSFEKELVYLYGASDTTPIANHYIKAIVDLEKLGIDAGDGVLSQAMIPSLKAAYEEVRHQTGLTFDPDKAAYHEYKLIHAQANQDPFEVIHQIMMDLYGEVFHSTHEDLDKAASLRTFLYIYKIRLMEMNGGFTEDDKNVLLTLAKSSEKLLSRFHHRSDTQSN
jgi:hypothetical protein